MATKKEQLADILDRYLDEVNDAPVSLDEVADWALRKNLFHPGPQDVRQLCKKALAEGARSQKRFDGKRWYRAKHAVKTNIGGVQLTLWADIDKNASREFIEKSIALRRRNVVDDCFQMKMDVDHFNDSNPEEKDIQLVLNFSDDVSEREMAEHLEQKKSA